MIKILISAAETSSDLHGAQLLRALKACESEEVVAFGMGGPELEAEGLRRIVDARQLLAMGFQEILSRLPRIFGALRTLRKAAIVEKPDVAVLLDYPDFHFRLARQLKKLNIPCIYYIPPKVWAWRRGRVHFLRKFFVRILSILPFESGFYQGQGIPVKYVGSPLADELPLELKKREARQSLGLAEEDLVLLLMPGSRPSELKQHTHLFLEAAAQVASAMRQSGFLNQERKLRVLLPIPRTASLEATRAQISLWLEATKSDSKSFFEVRLSQGNAHECMVAADAGIVKSGTSTLEAGILGCPHVVVYRPSRLTGWIFRYLIQYRGAVGLVNLVAGGLGQARESYLLREILMQDATSDAIAAEALTFFADIPKRERILRGLAAMRELVVGSGSGPSQRAAREILDYVKAHRGGQR